MRAGCETAHLRILRDQWHDRIANVRLGRSVLIRRHNRRSAAAASPSGLLATAPRGGGGGGCFYYCSPSWGGGHSLARAHSIGGFSPRLLSDGSRTAPFVARSVGDPIRGGNHRPFRSRPRPTFALTTIPRPTIWSEISARIMCASSRTTLCARSLLEIWSQNRTRLALDVATAMHARYRSAYP